MKNKHENFWTRALEGWWAKRSASTVLLPLSAVLSLACVGYLLADLRAAGETRTNPIFIAGQAVSNQVRAATSFTPRATVNDVVTKALAFKAMLTTAQQQTLELTS